MSWGRKLNEEADEEIFAHEAAAAERKRNAENERIKDENERIKQRKEKQRRALTAFVGSCVLLAGIGFCIGLIADVFNNLTALNPEIARQHFWEHALNFGSKGLFIGVIVGLILVLMGDLE